MKNIKNQGRHNVSVNLIIVRHQPRLSGECPITLVVTFSRERRYYKTGIAMLPVDFEILKNDTSANATERRKLLRSKPFLKNQFASVQEIKFQAEQTIGQLKVFSFGVFEQLFYESESSGATIVGSFNRYIKELKSEGRVATAVTYECAKNSLFEFAPKSTMSDVNPSWLKRYEEWMVQKGSSRTTIGIYLRNLRSIYNQSGLDRALYPFGKGRNKYQIPTSRNIKKALSLPEIGSIYNYEALSGSTEEMARDYWFFMYLSNGMNVKDMCRLRMKNIRGRVMTYQRAKTERSQSEAEEIQISLKDEAKEIIRKWGQSSIDPNAYIFPHLIGCTSALQELRTVQQLTKIINKHMKRIAQKVGINKPVTTYYARHSYATVLKRSGASIELISDLLGHSDTKTTQSYLDGFEQDHIHEVTNALTDFKKAN